jgi:hypothetical protein
MIAFAQPLAKALQLPLINLGSGRSRFPTFPMFHSKKSMVNQLNNAISVLDSFVNSLEANFNTITLENQSEAELLEKIDADAKRIIHGLKISFYYLLIPREYKRLLNLYDRFEEVKSDILIRENLKNDQEFAKMLAALPVLD